MNNYCVFEDKNAVDPIKSNNCNCDDYCPTKECLEFISNHKSDGKKINMKEIDDVISKNNIIKLEKIIGDKKVEGIKVVKTKLGPPDAMGRKNPIILKNSEKIIPVDKIIIAFGFQPSPAEWFKKYDIETKESGLLKVDNEYLFQTTNDKIFAGGDMTRGSDLVVTAVFEGREAAENILDYLEI